MRSEPTCGEKLLWSRLRGDQLNGLRFRRQHRIGEYLVDFYCATKHLVIEVDGSSHVEKSAQDELREQYLVSRGLTVLRFEDEDVIGNMDAVLEKIWRVSEAEEPSPQPSP